MELFSCSWVLTLVFIIILGDVNCTKFTFVNNCKSPVWPGVLSSAGSAKLETTGFQLDQGASRSLQAPSGWSGRFWGRTGCDFDSSGKGSCVTADCGSGQIECNGAGANPPATLAEFTLKGSGGKDFYDVSLVDGYNLPLIVEVQGGTGTCGSTGCVIDLNRHCPSELIFANGEACRSACEAFGKPEFCCSGAYSTPDTCKPSTYSQKFKSVCPTSYSYAYDDATSTFTCTDADYTITFCPSTTSQKSSTDPNVTGSTSRTEPRTAATGVILSSDQSFFASLATAGGTRILSSSSIIITTTATVTLFLIMSICS